MMRKAGVSPAVNWINVTLALSGKHKNKRNKKTGHPLSAQGGASEDGLL